MINLAYGFDPNKISTSDFLKFQFTKNMIESSVINLSQSIKKMGGNSFLVYNKISELAPIIKSIDETNFYKSKKMLFNYFPNIISNIKSFNSISFLSNKYDINNIITISEYNYSTPNSIINMNISIKCNINDYLLDINCSTILIDLFISFVNKYSIIKIKDIYDYYQNNINNIKYTNIPIIDNTIIDLYFSIISREANEFKYIPILYKNVDMLNNIITYNLSINCVENNIV